MHSVVTVSTGGGSLLRQGPVYGGTRCFGGSGFCQCTIDDGLARHTTHLTLVGLPSWLTFLISHRIAMLGLPSWLAWMPALLRPLQTVPAIDVPRPLLALSRPLGLAATCARHW